MNTHDLSNTLVGYGSTSESDSEDDHNQLSDNEDNELETEHENKSTEKKRKFVPRARQYLHLLEDDFDEQEEEEQEFKNKRNRIGTGSTVLENLPAPENLIANCGPIINFGVEGEFNELESRDDGPNLEPIQFQVEAAADESDIEEVEGIVTKNNLLENELAGIVNDDDDGDGGRGGADLGGKKNNLKQQFSKDSDRSREQNQKKNNNFSQMDQFQGLPKEVQEQLNKMGGNVKFSEIKAEDIRDTGPGGGANEHDPIVALGQDYALKQRSLAGEAPSRVARRKHQIGSLLHDARMNEMEFLLKESQGKKSKAETEAKYGWR